MDDEEITIKSNSIKNARVDDWSRGFRFWVNAIIDVYALR